MNSDGEQQVPEGCPPWISNGKKEKRWTEAFQQHMKGLSCLLKEMGKDYPLANIYVETGSSYLMVGESHHRYTEKKQQQFIVASAPFMRIDGGGW